MSNALQLLLNAECSSESDSDFNIEDHDEEDDDFSNDESEDNDSSGDSDDEESSGSETFGKKKKKSKTDATKQESDETNSNNNNAEKSSMSVEKRLEQAKIHSNETAKLLATVVCCACLGDRSDDTNEIVECDGCGITVHEGCYGVSDSVSVSSTVSSCSTEPWFCEACKANVKDPDCELCPNRGGIFKETDVGKWVHLVCALYVPGVAFGEVDQLSSVTLFEMPYSKWGSKTCSLCDDERFARTGVCIGCDAGMCKTFFHVTCAQKAGLLSEAHHEEADQADPFYAHCKMHSDKTLIKHRKRNFNALLLQVKKRELDKDNVVEEKPKPEQERIDRKLKKHRIKYVSNKLTKTEPWVPTQKMPRLLNTSASACKKLMLKAELMGIDAAAMEFQEAQIASLTDIRKKWHVPPAFSAEFVGYYLDRSIRLKEMKSNLERQLETNNSLLNQQQMLRNKYNDAMKVNSDVQDHNNKLKSEIIQLHTSILALCPNKQLPDINSIGRPLANNQHTSILTQSVVHSPSNTPTLSSTPPPQMLTSRTMSVPTAAALKMGVGFPLNNLMPGRKDDTGRILSTQCPNNDELLNECGICKRCTDQHLLAKCDTCHLYYHLGCLNPPLTRHPKKSKLYGWQCSECDKSDNSGPENVIIPKAPRRSRIRYSKDGSIVPDSMVEHFLMDVKPSTKKEEDFLMQSFNNVENGTSTNNGIVGIIGTNDIELKPKTEDYPQPVTPQHPKLQLTLMDSSPIEINSSPELTLKEEHNSPIDILKLSTLSTPEPKKKGRKRKNPLPVDIIPNIMNAMPIVKLTPLIPPIIVSNCMVNDFKHIIDLVDDKVMVKALVPQPPSVDIKVPKKGRPRKEKRSLSQISQDLQKQQEIQMQQQLEQESGVLDLTKKDPVIICDEPEILSSIYRPPNFNTLEISSSIPYPVTELPKIINTPSTTMTLSAVNCLSPPQSSTLQPSLQLPLAATITATIAPAPAPATTITQPPPPPSSAIIVNCNAIKSPVKCDTNGLLPVSPLTSPITSNGDLSTSFINEYGNGSGHHKHKKRKSHKRRHSHSPNSSDRQSSKEHKRKRKRKNHDMENPNDIQISSKDDRPVEQPRIKIKFKAIPLPAGSNKNQTQFFYVPSESNDVPPARPMEICRTNSLEDLYAATNDNVEQIQLNVSPLGNGHHSTPTTKVHKRKKLSPTKQSRLLLSISPIKTQSTAITTTNFAATSTLISATVVSATSSTANKSLPLPSQICDVCQMSGTNQNLVKCDDCQKCYHFHCLDPPLKKNPKKRGYMWHCSDCDPTDRENN